MKTLVQYQCFYLFLVSGKVPSHEGETRAAPAPAGGKLPRVPGPRQARHPHQPSDTAAAGAQLRAGRRIE